MGQKNKKNTNYEIYSIETYDKANNIFIKNKAIIIDDIKERIFKK